MIALQSNVYVLEQTQAAASYVFQSNAIAFYVASLAPLTWHVISHSIFTTNFTDSFKLFD